jgi:putative colanic acid biosysnthesis UDP-glucose lipid carrier transferase
MSQNVAPVVFRKATRMPVGRDQLLNMLEYFLGPLALAVSLWGVALAVDGSLAPRYVILSIIVFSLTFPGPAFLTLSLLSVFRRIVVSWLAITGLLFVFGFASGYLDYFGHEVLMTWWWLAPTSELISHLVLRRAAPTIMRWQGQGRRAIIAGMNAQGVELIRRLGDDPYSRIDVVGFFDDRNDARISQRTGLPILGNLSTLPAFARDNHIDVIYISLPMASQPRIVSLLDGLHDTTASIYFVPDIFVTDLIQGRIDSVGGLPIVAVCESPFTGLNGIVKRVSDIILSLLILALIAVPMIAIAIAVKLSSPGPVIFRQRRYGLDGNEFIVYKFRTMKTLDDGAIVAQAQKDDERVTEIGRFLRRASLDELPQFINVLQGRMSIVGPRPHAVAHNEIYRKLIKGYMLRHKVKPGITGWAQVNGYRGETEVLEKMKARIDYDLEYLRNWSLRLDLHIIAKTVLVVLGEKNAY